MHPDDTTATSPLRTSAETTELAKALAAAQGAITVAAFDRENPHFRSHYATLASIYAACRPALAANGLAVVQALSDGANGRLALTTRLMHSSGQWMESTVSVAADKTGAQALGSAATYLRRYALVSLIGVATGEDDDGNAADGKGEPPPKDAPKRRTREQIASDKAAKDAADRARQAEHDPSWDADRARFCAEMKERGIEYEDLAEWLEMLGGKRPSKMDQRHRDDLRMRLTPAKLAEAKDWVMQRDEALGRGA